MRVPFTLERWQDVKLQPEQAHAPPSRDDYLRLDSEGEAWAFVDSSGHALMCGGFVPNPENAGEAYVWSYVGSDAGQHMTRLVRESRRVLASSQDRWPVMRAITLVEFEAGHRLLKLLGFKDLGAAPMTVKGRSYTVFERARHGGH